jgi:ubiquinone biosynthesis protein
MVVVEGVARSLDPRINIWEVASPIVERYIRETIGPKAVLRDLVKTARVLARFGPKLPALVEAQLIRTGNPADPVRQTRPPKRWLMPTGLALAAFAIGLVLGHII